MLTGILKNSLTLYNEVNSLEKKNEVSNQIAGMGDIDLSTTWMSNTIDWGCSSNLSSMSISSCVEYETGNINMCSCPARVFSVFIIGTLNKWKLET